MAARWSVIDLNAGHVAAMVVDPSGNPIGQPITVPLDLVGLLASTRDGHLRQAVSELILVANENDCRAIVIEDLDFKDARELGREHRGHRPSWGRRGKSFRRLVSGIPTAKFRDRLVQMATNAGLVVVAVDPAYTSKWGAEHWLGSLQTISDDASGHHAAALVIARRGRRSEHGNGVRCASTPAEHRESCPSVRAARSSRYSGSPVRAAREGHRNPKGPKAAASAAQDPGDPGPFGATRKAGLSSAECLGAVLVQRERRALHDLIARTAVVYSWDARAARLRWLARADRAPSGSHRDALTRPGEQG